MPIQLVSEISSKYIIFMKTIPIPIPLANRQMLVRFLGRFVGCLLGR